MFFKGLATRVLKTISSKTSSTSISATKRNVCTSMLNHKNTQLELDRAVVFQQSPPKESVSTATVSEYVSRLCPFTAPPPPQPVMTTPTAVIEELEMTSVLRKRRLKMNKHKHKKLRKRTRALRKKLGK